MAGITELLRGVPLRPTNVTEQKQLDTALERVAAQVANPGWVPSNEDKAALESLKTQGFAIQGERGAVWKGKNDKVAALSQEVNTINTTAPKGWFGGFKNNADKAKYTAAQTQLEAAKTDLKNNGPVAEAAAVNAGTVAHRANEQLQYALQRDGGQGALGKTVQQWQGEFAGARTEAATAGVLKNLGAENASQGRSLTAPGEAYRAAIAVDAKDSHPLNPFDNTPVDAQGKASAEAGLRELAPAQAELSSQGRLYQQKMDGLRDTIGARLAGQPNSPYQANAQRAEKVEALKGRVSTTQNALGDGISDSRKSMARLRTTAAEITDKEGDLARAKSQYDAAKTAITTATTQVTSATEVVSAREDVLRALATDAPGRPTAQSNLDTAKRSLDTARAALRTASDNESRLSSVPARLEGELRVLNDDRDTETRRLGRALNTTDGAVTSYLSKVRTENNAPTAIPGVRLDETGLQTDQLRLPFFDMLDLPSRLNRIETQLSSIQGRVNLNDQTMTGEINRVKDANRQLVDAEVTALMR